MEEIIKKNIQNALTSLGFPEEVFVVEHPELIQHGDYSTNIALVLAKKVGQSPASIAQTIMAFFNEHPIDYVQRITFASPGFINFFLSPQYFRDTIDTFVSQSAETPLSHHFQDQKIIVEYTDPNPIKEFHIGHLMSNAIGESMSRIIESNGAEVKRACYQGDIGLHVAKAVGYKLKHNENWNSVEEVARSYSLGSKLYDADQAFKDYVITVNKRIYDETDETVNDSYQAGRRLTLDYFETIYKKLGTKFDFYFFESTTGEFGKALVHKHPEIFETSEGAIVFRGERRDPSLHTRVFINKEGLPTYEAKELGLAKIKYDAYPYDISIVITGNEINDYFRVLLSAMKEIFPHLAEKTMHVSHGMLRLPSGKMSSRTGDVITAEWLINEVKKKVIEKIETSDRSIPDKETLAEDVAVGAIKYSILKQAPGRDIIFDFDKSLSFEGDSGPYLQYTYARTQSLLEKAKSLGIVPTKNNQIEISLIEKMLARFPEIVFQAGHDRAPHSIISYLTLVAGLFNRFYAEEVIVKADDQESPHKVFIAHVVGVVLRRGLFLLGIKAPERM